MYRIMNDDHMKQRIKSLYIGLNRLFRRQRPRLINSYVYDVMNRDVNLSKKE